MINVTILMLMLPNKVKPSSIFSDRASFVDPFFLFVCALSYCLACPLQAFRDLNSSLPCMLCFNAVYQNNFLL